MQFAVTLACAGSHQNGVCCPPLCATYLGGKAFNAFKVCRLSFFKPRRILCLMHYHGKLTNCFGLEGPFFND